MDFKRPRRSGCSRLGGWRGVTYNALLREGRPRISDLKNIGPRKNHIWMRLTKTDLENSEIKRDKFYVNVTNRELCSTWRKRQWKGFDLRSPLSYGALAVRSTWGRIREKIQPSHIIQKKNHLQWKGILSKWYEDYPFKTITLKKLLWN